MLCRGLVTELGRLRRGVGGEGREETIMTSFNSFSPTLSPSCSLLPRQRSERIAQIGNHKSPLNMGAFGLSVSCCNKNVRQVCELGVPQCFKPLSTHMRKTPNKSLTHSRAATTLPKKSPRKPVQQCE